MQLTEIIELFNLPTVELAVMADRIRRENLHDQFETCTICNAKCGKCTEDCRYCAQSVHYKTDIDEYPLVSSDKMVQAAGEAAAIGSGRFGIVTSGRGLDSSEVEEVAQAISSIAKRGDIKPCASLGILSFDHFKRLKDAGLDRYHHNIETASTYFEKVTSTHSFDERLRTIDLARKAGLSVCCGGIIGMGESREDRAQMALELAQIAPDSIPVNVLMPIPGTPFENCDRISVGEALKTISVLRIMNPKSVIRLAAGRESFFKDFMGMAFLAGANAMMVGGYLTQRGRSVEEDRAFAREVLAAWVA